MNAASSTRAHAPLAGTSPAPDRYIRQRMFAPIGTDGQRRLLDAHVALVGCGALGSAVADSLARAGVGTLTIIDRDFVELHNLQRQSLFQESDVRDHLPKAEAAAARLRTVNGDVRIAAVVADVNAANILELTADADVLVDGTDNFETRYLINDAAFKTGRPWVYGGVIASYGMSMTIRPGITSCLRCVFPDPPDAGSAPTCDTAGVLGPAVHMVAAIQSAEVIKLAVGAFDAINTDLLAIDLWSLSFDRVPLPGPRSDCPMCGPDPRFDFLERVQSSRETVLCGHDAVQIVVRPEIALDLPLLAERLRPAGDVLLTRFLLRFTDAVSGRQMTVFPNGRAIVKGVSEPTDARIFYDRFIGR
ncbi:MAG: ThiF family adenylyltransferase [Thermomicrobiales bacterium]